MLAGIDLTNKVVLEPQAGKGNIVDYLNSWGAREVLCCEIESDLRSILEGKNCRVIKDDFLELRSEEISHIDMIIMNPPFSKCEDHILHAWQIAPPGCHIISLCNSNMVKNFYSGKRKEIITIVNEYGSRSNLGQVFKDSERPTNVEISLLSIQKPANDYDIEFQGFFMEEEEEVSSGSGLLRYNEVRDVVNRYIQSVKIFDQQIKAASELNFIAGSYFRSQFQMNVTTTGHRGTSMEVTRNQFKKDFQKSGWNWVFSKLKMEKYTTKGLREELNRFVEQQQEIPFTMRNIYHMIDMVIQTSGQRMDKALLEVFDKVTRHYSENRYNVEGWKTNSHYVLNEKFIFPGMTDLGWHGEMQLNTYNRERVDDLIKGLCYITGMNHDSYLSLWEFFNTDYIVTDENFQVIIRESKRGDYGKSSMDRKIQKMKDSGNWRNDYRLIERPPLEFGKWHLWEPFFYIRGYKKGTMHFKFKDKRVWELFNQRIARLKGFVLYENA